MEIEIWWLLALPVFFGLGWLAARIDIRQVVSESKTLPRSYFTGLNFLLNEQQDKAIDAFIEAMKVDPETSELHFALGSLFRRRGEIDRAIRIHQTLVNRQDIEEEQRLQALSELGQDYLKAGLLDRAESVFTKLKGTPLNQQALHSLLDIYQQEQNWEQAIEIAQILPDHETILWHREMSNFYCELASKELADSRFEKALSYVEEALIVNPKSVRASMIQGDIRAAQGDLEGALKAWKRVEIQDPLYIALVAERIFDTYKKLDKSEQGMQLLKTYLERHPSLDLLDEVFRWELNKEGPRAAYELVREELRRNPTLLGLDKLLEAAALTVTPEQRDDVELIKQLIHGHTRRVARYRCVQCGFKARQFYWRCPACGGWETYPPKRTEEFDLAP